jgi:hypothetical protein
MLRMSRLVKPEQTMITDVATAIAVAVRNNAIASKDVEASDPRKRDPRKQDLGERESGKQGAGKQVHVPGCNHPVGTQIIYRGARSNLPRVFCELRPAHFGNTQPYMVNKNTQLIYKALV